jgi:hypothetical protein
LACAICNNNKGDYYDDTLSLINPYIDEPEEEFVAVGFLMWESPGHDRAAVTESLLRLNRLELFERRKERLDRLHSLATVYAKAEHEVHKRLLRQQLIEEAADDKEYAFIVRCYLRGTLGIAV